MKRYLTLAALLLSFSLAYCQEAPKMEFVCELNVKLNPALVPGETPHGIRRIIPITGGTVTGPAIKGEIIDGGADWQIIRKDGVAEIDARYAVKTDDGTLIYIKNTGIRVASAEVAAKLAKGEAVPASEYYFRTVLTFEAPLGKYDWLNKALFVCNAEKVPGAAIIRVWRVL
ncbi:DUF3237 domain-containing protein [Mucilaginibacter gotjawali]|uniref:Uncharacterized protein n=2 Tax=Mucilaginibacter gotjawali TaxID=1550579 RepID=A0A839SLI5_9SPHI|nr:DUF3237 domain-containing protein [Mucilaginibacter gotjawali]MBB3058173.1 hypothetical protein [Mucilaginibacter gotjawali]BAU54871.1 hypothetical protein MgSA37_03050 [Mucilaginibacter gotjawali]